MSITTPARVIGAIGAAVAAYAHISLYRAGYSDIPVANIGPQFLLNAAAAIAITIGLLATMVMSVLPPWVTRATAAIGMVWATISLVAYSLSHSDRGWMGYRDGPDFFVPSPEGAMSVFGEAAVLVACAILVVMGTAGRIEVDH